LKDVVLAAILPAISLHVPPDPVLRSSLKPLSSLLLSVQLTVIEVVPPAVAARADGALGGGDELSSSSTKSSKRPVPALYAPYNVIEVALPELKLTVTCVHELYVPPWLLSTVEPLFAPIVPFPSIHALSE
jgi:hypothetical protein